MNKPKDDKKANNGKQVREPTVAGQFYPGDKDILAEKINEYLSQAEEGASSSDIRAILVPHAGYEYSAPVAAYAYSALRGRQVNSVILISNSHASYFDGLAIAGGDAWRTPLGAVEIDRDLADGISDADPAFMINRQVHEKDHTLEVQLPFLQTVLEPGFKIVPILFGNTQGDLYEKLAEILTKSLSGDDLIIISTDLSHYPGYADAIAIDTDTLDKIMSLDIDALASHISGVEAENIPGEETLCCGIDAVKTVMAIASGNDWRAKVLKYANSGDAPGGVKDRVVGYGAIVFSGRDTGADDTGAAETAMKSGLTPLQQAELLSIARQSVAEYVNNGRIKQFKIADPRLMQKAGAFVTIHKAGELRGCIGQIVPGDEPLWQVVREMAIAAATDDHRFTPIGLDELEKIDYEISVLSVPQKVKNWQEIELGTDGVIVKKDKQSGVFLPQVATETGWDREELLSQLCLQKAALPPDCYKDDSGAELLTFKAQVFSESEKK